jgi:hypothetical protein
VILNYDQYPTSVEQYAKRVFGDPKHAWQTNKKQSAKTNKTKSKNKQKTKQKQNLHFKKIMKRQREICFLNPGIHC